MRLLGWKITDSSTKKMNPDIQSLSHEEISQLREKAKNVKLGLLEELVVNIFTPPDLILHGPVSYVANVIGYHFEDSIKGTKYEKFLTYMMQPPKGTFAERARKMWHGKNEDYKLLIAMQEEHGCIPDDIKRVYQLSPCGAAKLAALHVRK